MRKHWIKASDLRATITGVADEFRVDGELTPCVKAKFNAYAESHSATMPKILTTVGICIVSQALFKDSENGVPDPADLTAAMSFLSARGVTLRPKLGMASTRFFSDKQPNT